MPVPPIPPSLSPPSGWKKIKVCPLVGKEQFLVLLPPSLPLLPPTSSVVERRDGDQSHQFGRDHHQSNGRWRNGRRGEGGRGKEGSECTELALIQKAHLQESPGDWLANFLRFHWLQKGVGFFCIICQRPTDVLPRGKARDCVTRGREKEVDGRHLP